MNVSASTSSQGADRPQTESGDSTGADQERPIGARQLSTDSVDNPRTADAAALERRLATGRESQRRFRERQKARSQEVEAQLSKATTELVELRNRQAELEARNQLLENLTNLKKPVESKLLRQAQEAQAAQQPESSPEPAQGPETEPKAAPEILISVAQPPYRLTAEAASKLTVRAFSALWTEYVRRIGGLLLQIGDGSAPNIQHAVLSMQSLTVEAFKLIQCMLHNPLANKVLTSSRLDDGTPAANTLNNDFYTNLLNLIGLTGEQTQDIITIQRVYNTKRASLDKQRKAVVRQMGEYEQQGLHPSDSFVALSLLAEKVQDITAKDFKVYCAVVSGLYQGVLTTQQLAGVIVHGYPFLPIMDKVLGAVAARGGVSPADVENTEHVAEEWRQFEAYVTRIATQVWHDYVPMRAV